MRREKLENLVTTGMLEGKRSRGKQREKLIEGLADWLKAGKSLEAIEATKDRKKWRTMIANAVGNRAWSRAYCMAGRRNTCNMFTALLIVTLSCGISISFKVLEVRLAGRTLDSFGLRTTHA
ncbi:hypothetical protein PoB_006132400 [Plakobranchus ocellatus]|uniref:Uncharacterized protein n=1 Tax=Plakobranchus ocellatus TaxID=259542 RepID=A0AAV4CSF0_9GAST|nr:hypothetical protein PoB_006132400 [Plakobranchus ocellatus]